jgi:hypothetical protein
MMTKADHKNWLVANHDYLAASLSVLRCGLERYLADLNGISEKNAEYESAKQKQQEAAKELPAPSALETLCSIFGLSSFERDVLLLCAGVELDTKFTSLCTILNGGSSKVPTFSAALAALPDPHWSALTPAAPLRYWRLVEIGSGHVLTLAPLRIDERILHYLTGVQHLDDRLVGLTDSIQMSGDLIPSHRTLADRIVAIWSQSSHISKLPVVQLSGDEVTGKQDIAVAVCSAIGLNPCIISAQAIPSNSAELESLIRLWEREVFLSGRALLVDCENIDAREVVRNAALMRFTERTRGAIIILSRERLALPQRPMFILEVHKPGETEQRTIWENTLNNADIHLDGKLDYLISQFSMSATAIQTVCSEAVGKVEILNGKMNNGSPYSDADLNSELWDVIWDSCRLQTQPRLDNLAQRIEPVATLKDLVLPRMQMQILREIAVHVRQRRKVYDAWGFAKKNSRGLGISALFTGASGTGKTMAAELLANELRLDLYRIDLSQVVSKYIGETEKNLRRVFDAAEEGGAILLFDEADALFGKRSEVKDSHDRFANIEISYLLQRMESYRGLAILTTNMKEALDQAFLRRIRFVVQFPFPDATQRVEIWRRIFPTSTPTEYLDLNKLARLNVAGGNIRNIALNAAFLAADAGERVSMKYLLRAARGEYVKLERPLTEAEIGEWI